MNLKSMKLTRNLILLNIFDKQLLIYREDRRRADGFSVFKKRYEEISFFKSIFHIYCEKSKNDFSH